MMDKYKDWTKYHITHSKGLWKFYREGMKRSIRTHKDRNLIIKEALYHLCNDGGALFVHKEDASIDFIVDNWVG